MWQAIGLRNTNKCHQMWQADVLINTKMSPTLRPMVWGTHKKVTKMSQTDGLKNTYKMSPNVTRWWCEEHKTKRHQMWQDDGVRNTNKMSPNATSWWSKQHTQNVTKCDKLMDKNDHSPWEVHYLCGYKHTNKHKQ